MSKTKKRRADGSLRPSVLRYRQRKSRERDPLRNMTPGEKEEAKRERAEWLARFDLRERTAFFRGVNMQKTVFLRAFARELGMEQEEAWPLLERLADERNWMKLKTKDGMVVGAGPLQPYKSKKRRPKIHAPRIEEEAA